jgi:farnesyl-diphosphate farnesyltransferase
MNPPDVTRDLLRSVSRTFYFSVRILPAALREAMGVAYLLARTSDTIADSENAPVAMRLRRLEEFGKMVQSGPTPQFIGNIQRDIQPAHEGERTLIVALPRVLERFGSFRPWEWKETIELLANIIRGQSNDLCTFPDPAQITALPDAYSLEDYTYLVAGCVGEWWTRMSYHYFPRYSKRAEQELMPLASAFGKALQLVNILRDLPADLRAGRCYLPADELQSAGADPGSLLDNPAAAQPVFEAWLAKARGYLDDGREYIRAIRPWRIRFACYLPWRLAVKTLDLMSATSPLGSAEKVKVSRGMVYGTMLRGLVAAFSNAPLR